MSADKLMAVWLEGWRAGRARTIRAAMRKHLDLIDDGEEMNCHGSPAMRRVLLFATCHFRIPLRNRQR